MLHCDGMRGTSAHKGHRITGVVRIEHENAPPVLRNGFKRGIVGQDQSAMTSIAAISDRLMNRSLVSLTMAGDSPRS